MSWKNYNWVLPNTNLDHEDIVERILINRFGKNVDVSEFLNAEFDLYDPFLMYDMPRATRRIRQAIENKEKIAIFGDYDVDGVTSTALMSEFFSFIGCEVQVYIPDRYGEGYGLKSNSLMSLKENGIDLVITVDCGIKDWEAIDGAQARGLDIIVTDHHNIGEKIPDCSAVLNPKRSLDKYPQKDLAGVGVAFVLIRALLDELKIDSKKAEWFIKWNLDLVAIGTIADMVPLVGENRVLAKYGLIVVNRRSRVGLRELLAVAGKTNSEITASEIGYIIAPRLNAAGRLDHALNAYNLLVEKSELEAMVLAKNLNNSNTKRQEITSNILNQAFGLIDSKNIPSGIFLADKQWPSGVVGLVCSRLTDRFNRPSFVGEISNGTIKGSARSIEGINIVEVLDIVKNKLDHYGGHDMAAGFSLPVSKWNDFKNKLEMHLAEKIRKIDDRKKMIIDDVVDSDSFNISLWQNINLLQPFGISNREPLFMLPKVNLSNKSVIGRDKDHIKLIFSSNGKEIEGLWWRNAQFAERFKIGDSYDVVFRFDVNEYRGNETIYMNMLDVKPSF